MRRILNGSISLAKARPSTESTSTYLCLACRNRRTPFSTSTRRPAEETEEFETRRQTPIEASHWGTPGKPDAVPWAGGFGRWWAKNWDPKFGYRDGFVPKPGNFNTSSPELITAAFYRALVEVYACKQAGLPLMSVSMDRKPPFHKVQIHQSEGGIELDFSKSPVTLNTFVSSLQQAKDSVVENEVPTESEEDVAADRSPVDPLHPESSEPVEETATNGSPTESEQDVGADRSPVNPLIRKSQRKAFEQASAYAQFVATCDPSWHKIPLVDPEIKFAILKRVIQLTGIRIPDSAIQPSRTAKAFLSHVSKPPKPRKLAEAIPTIVGELPNVKFADRRITPIDKEKQVGRWKLIKEELKSRHLPVTGF